MLPTIVMGVWSRGSLTLARIKKQQNLRKERYFFIARPEEVQPWESVFCWDEREQERVGER